MESARERNASWPRIPVTRSGAWLGAFLLASLASSVAGCRDHNEILIVDAAPGDPRPDTPAGDSAVEQTSGGGKSGLVDGGAGGADGGAGSAGGD